MFKVNQNVWCAIYGAGVVVEVQHTSGGAYQVRFNNGRTCLYASDGKYCADSSIVLFPYPIEITKAVTKPSIDWTQIKDEYKWLAVDVNNCAYVYENEPNIDGIAYWSTSSATYFCVNGLVSYSRGTCDWKESLVKRPE